MNKQQFDDAIGAVPPSTVDVDAVIARQRRAVLVRRVAAPGAAAVAGVVAVTFGIAIAASSGSGGSGGTLPASQPATSPAPTSASERTPARSLPCKGAAEDVPTAAARLSSTLTAAVRRQIPGAELTASSTADFGEAGRFGPLEFFLVGNDSEYDFDDDCMDADGYFLARADVSDAAGLGNITAHLESARTTSASRPECGNPQVQEGLISCTPGTGPNGETYIAETANTQEGATYHRVDFVKPDGTRGALMTENVAGSIKLGKPAQRPTPPLTVEQLVAVALDPGLTLYPTR